MGKHRLYVALTAVLLMLGGYIYHGYAYSVLPQPAYYLLRDMPSPKATDRVLCFSPHPDDETIAAGGYLCLAQRAGAEIRIVLATDGNKHGLKDLRYQEFRRATGILGIPEKNLVFWGYPDGHLRAYCLPLKSRIAWEINNFSPTVVLYPHPADHHPDHAVLGEMVEEVLKEQGYTGKECLACRYLVHHRYFPQPKALARQGYLLPPVAMLSFDQQWLKFPLPAEVLHCKAEAIEQYRTQLRNPFLRPLLHSFIRQNELFARWTP
ncbi:PIG-L deacetylase family protein [Ammonifex thiophilus]|uniref:PIG-L family deacetylase n=1 Tax=Ammonifex thiophilus TaxID=444093 RepID=A0A3D8P4E0_9THEO|nr:PIG-L family deacetylase [Ammonifex thiophilus]RDV82978.1 PIG-L family deacetylase [Ammonifex thiophilus]